MTDPEFAELIGYLHRESALHGDLGHEYWTRVIAQLKEMHALARLHQEHCPRDHALEARYLAQTSSR